MCGINTMVVPKDPEIAHGIEVVEKMNQLTRYRGPDQTSVTAVGRVIMGHNRLSILGLLNNVGAQPIQSRCGRYTMVFNGEIYNYEDLSLSLSVSLGCEDKTSDTRVLIEFISEHGFANTLNKLEGMFALVVFDSLSQELFIGRDRFGEKPLAFGFYKKYFLSISDLTALKALDVLQDDIDFDALSLFFTRGHIPAPHSIFKGINKLLPGHWAKFSLDTFTVSEPRSYIEAPQSPRIENCRNFQKKLDEFEFIFEEAVSKQLVSEVPVGAFLSGGYDSTAVCIAASKVLGKKLVAHTVGIKSKKYNEAEFAVGVATHLGIRHHVDYVEEESLLESIEDSVNSYDEPFADSSQIPTWVLCNSASKNLTVALSGDGADEMFCGYQRYFWCQSIWGTLSLGSPIPAKWVRSATRRLSQNDWVLKHVRQLDRVLKASRFIGVPNAEIFYTKFLEFPTETRSVFRNPHVSQLKSGPKLNVKGFDFFKHMMSVDLVGYLPNDILVKVDRASMANSLETRAPFLTKELYEFSLSLGLEDLIAPDQKSGKKIIKEYVHRYVPEKIMNRPKKGFNVPLADWLRGPLKNMVESSLGDQAVFDNVIFDRVNIELYWKEHLSGSRNWSYLIWCLVCYATWHKKFFN